MCLTIRASPRCLTITNSRSKRRRAVELHSFRDERVSVPDLSWGVSKRHTPEKKKQCSWPWPKLPNDKKALTHKAALPAASAAAGARCADRLLRLPGSISLGCVCAPGAWRSACRSFARRAGLTIGG